MKSVLTQSTLDALCERFHIPDVVHPELPGHNDRIRNSPVGKIGVYSRKRDTAYQRQVFTRKRVFTIPNTAYPPSAILYALIVTGFNVCRSTTKELITPFENPKSAFLKRRLYETLSLVESSSPELDLFSDIKEHSEEETTEIMTETMKKYMSKTRGNYRSGVVRPKINDKTHFELKGQYLQELRENTFSGSKHEDANEHIEKFLEIVDLFHIPKVTQDQYCPPARIVKKMEEINNFQQEPDESLFRAWERFKELLMKCPQHYLTDMQEVILFYNGLDVPTRQILDSKGAIPTKTIADAKVAIQEMAEYSQKWHKETSSKARITKTCDGLAKGPHYTKDCPLKEEGNTLEEAYYTQFGAPYQPIGQYRAAGLCNTPKNQDNAAE
ncbi:ribonuclease H-like domain-containing protein, partial [Tanacetum coccineum]